MKQVLGLSVVQFISGEGYIIAIGFVFLDWVKLAVGSSVDSFSGMTKVKKTCTHGDKTLIKM